MFGAPVLRDFFRFRNCRRDSLASSQIITVLDSRVLYPLVFIPLYPLSG